jgi:hypothetical protein
MTTRSPSTEKARAKGKHAVLETVTLSGTAVGAAAGAVAGPVGAIAGGVIGTAVGFVAGATLEKEGQRGDAHDRELDRTIGVEEGDLGAKEIARSRLSTPRLMLRCDHDRLELLYAELLEAFHEGDWDEVGTVWTDFETRLRAHFAAEEEALFPRMREAHPEEVDALLRDHGDLRRLLAELGVDVDLHAVREDVAQALIARLRAHAKREDGIAYHWADRELTASDLDALLP